MLSEHQKETAFLRRCISFEEGADGRQLDERIVQVLRDERCLRRAAWLMTLVTALMMACFGYLAVLLDDFPEHMSLFATLFITKTVCALGIGSLISLLIFVVLGIRCRRELNLRREECRRFVTNLLESRPGTLRATHPNGELNGKEVRALQGELPMPITDGLNRLRAP